MKRLEGRVALSSGALRGIGLAIAERYHAEGAEVVLADLANPGDPSVAKTLAELPGSRYFKLDVAQEDQWQRVEQGVRSSFGRLDVLVNNAGVDCTGAVETLEFSAWRRIMSINVDGVFLGTKTLTPLLAESGRSTRFGSSVINISSSWDWWATRTRAPTTPERARFACSPKPSPSNSPRSAPLFESTPFTPAL
jgi:NAD(P)-dependent dehydrogenase (short-subunit alcohol dehydrogenase family)